VRGIVLSLVAGEVGVAQIARLARAVVVEAAHILAHLFDIPAIVVL
jgi:hypothetical protein